ncbi:hypothetical protein, partial [Modestobacter versicolor]
AVGDPVALAATSGAADAAGAPGTSPAPTFPGFPGFPAPVQPLTVVVPVGSCGISFGTASGSAGSPAAVLCADLRVDAAPTSEALLRPGAELVVSTTSDPGSRPD